MSSEYVSPDAVDSPEELVPESVMPQGTLPPMRFRDLPEPVSWRKMIGPSLMLAGLALAITARRRGERGRLASTALSWNTLLLIIYAVMLVALLDNPFSAT